MWVYKKLYLNRVNVKDMRSDIDIYFDSSSNNQKYDFKGIKTKLLSISLRVVHL